MVPEELTNEELFELEPDRQDHIAKESTREKENAGEGKIILQIIHCEGVSRSFCRPQQAP